MVILATVVMIVPVTFFRDHLLYIYTDNAELIKLSHGPIAMVTGSALFLGTGFTLFQGVSGTGNTMISLLIEGFVLLLYVIAVYIFVYVLEWNLTLVWTAEYIYAFLLGLISLLYLLSGKWKGKTV
jgi:Na+-driven multidrug efflux pump